MTFAKVLLTSSTFGIKYETVWFNKTNIELKIYLKIKTKITTMTVMNVSGLLYIKRGDRWDSWRDLVALLFLVLAVLCISPPILLLLSHRIGFGCWVRRRPKRFFTVTLCRENLSSGENRAGWAELVGCPTGQSFCRWQRSEEKSSIYVHAGEPLYTLASGSGDFHSCTI